MIGDKEAKKIPINKHQNREDQQQQASYSYGSDNAFSAANFPPQQWNRNEQNYGQGYPQRPPFNNTNQHPFNNGLQHPNMQQRPPLQHPNMPPMQHPNMQRPPMQHPNMQRPPMQHPNMQRPPMQHPNMQRPPLQQSAQHMQHPAQYLQQQMHQPNMQRPPMPHPMYQQHEKQQHKQNQSPYQQAPSYMMPVSSNTSPHLLPNAAEPVQKPSYMDLDNNSDNFNNFRNSDQYERDSDSYAGSTGSGQHSPYLNPNSMEERPTFTTMIRKMTIARQKTKIKLTIEEQIAQMKPTLNKNDQKTSLEYAKLCLSANEKYSDEGYSILKKLAGSGFPEANYCLGEAYSDDGKLSNAYTQFYSAAKKSYAPACFKVGDCAESGKGCKKSTRLALEMYTKGATAGDLSCMYRLGRAEMNGELGLRPDIQKAVKWFKRACAVPNPDMPEPLFELFKIYEQGVPPYIAADVEYARGCLIEASDFGYIPATFRLGYSYEHQLLGFEINPVESIKLYKIAADANHAEAQLSLAGWYMTGVEDVMEPDLGLALSLAKKAADQGLPRAVYTLGYFYERGIGVEPNQATAMKYYQQSADMGESRAIKRVLQDNPGATIKNYNDKKKKGGFFGGMFGGKK